MGSHFVAENDDPGFKEDQYIRVNGGIWRIDEIHYNARGTWLELATDLSLAPDQAHWVWFSETGAWVMCQPSKPSPEVVRLPLTPNEQSIIENALREYLDSLDDATGPGHGLPEKVLTSLLKTKTEAEELLRKFENI